MLVKPLAKKLEGRLGWWIALGPLFLLLTLLISQLSQPLLWAAGALLSATLATLVISLLLKESRAPIAHLQQELTELRAAYLDYRRARERDDHIETIKMSELATLQEERNALLLELLQKPPAPLLQLRQQFEEKKELLHQTRVQLWHAESNSLRLEHEKAAAALEPDPHFDALTEPLEAVAQAQADIEALESLVSELLEELKSRSIPTLSGFAHLSQ